MRLCLVEDNAVAGLEPLTLTRPAFELLLGADPLGAKIARALGVGPGPRAAPPSSGPTWPPSCRAARPPRRRQRPRLAGPRPRLRRQRPLGPARRLRPPDDHAPWLGTCDGRPACAWSAPRQAVALQPGSRRRLVRRPGRRGSAPSSWAASGSTAPGTW